LAICLPPYIVFWALNANIFACGFLIWALIANIMLFYFAIGDWESEHPHSFLTSAFP